MVVRELVTKLGFKTDTGPLVAYDKRVESAKRSTQQLDNRVRQARTGIQTFGVHLSAFNRKFNTFSANMETKFGPVLKPLRALGSNIPIIGGALQGMTAGGIAATAAIGGLTAGVFAMVGAVRKATQLYTNFEQGLKGVERVTLATKKEMDALKRAAIEAGEASIFSTADAAEAEKFLAQAGLSVQDTIKALPGTLQLAAAGQIELGSAAEIATKVLTSNRLAVEELGRVNDVLAYTANRTNSDVLGLASSFATVGNTGALAGIPIEELATYLGVLANNGLNGSIAGTLLRNAFVSLMAPTPKLSKAMKGLGINLQEMFDESGKFRKGALIKFFGQMSTAMKEGRINAGEIIDIFGERAGRAIATFAATGSTEIGGLLGEIEKSGGTAERAAKIAFKGMTGAGALFASRMEAASNQAFEMSGVKDIFEQLVRILADLLPPLVRALGVILAPIGKALAFILTLLRPVFASIGGIINLLAKMLGLVFKPLIDELDRGIEAVAEFSDVIFDGFDIAFKATKRFFDSFFQYMRPAIDLAWKLNEIFGIMGQDTIKQLGISLWNNVLKPLFPFVRLLDLMLGGAREQLKNAPGGMEAPGAVGGMSAVQRILRGAEGGGGTNNNMSFQGGNISVTVNAQGQGDAEAIAEMTGKAVRTQFNMELRRVLTEVGY